jgi:hypothetical protein
MNLHIANAFMDSIALKENKNVETFIPMWKRRANKWLSFIPWKLVIFVILWLWCICRILIGPKIMAKIYYNLVARWCNEPLAEDLEESIFGRNLEDLLKTIIECIVKPSLFEKIKEYKNRVRMLVGYNDDLYHPYTRLLLERNANVTLHRTIGDHHMIYHHPRATALKVSCMIGASIY